MASISRTEWLTILMLLIKAIIDALDDPDNGTTP
jgi:hypothetical protein